jgi:hypothetical protein
MHLLFLDESGRIGQDGLFALGGIAVRDSDWHELRRRWVDTLDAHGWPADREVKWHGIRTGEVPPALADAVIDTLAHASFTCYVVLLDCDAGAELPEFFATPERT